MAEAIGRTGNVRAEESDRMGHAHIEALRMALCVVSEPVLVVDTRAERIVEANPPACALVGLSMAEIRRARAGEVLQRIGLEDLLRDGLDREGRESLALGPVPEEPNLGEPPRWRIVGPSLCKDGILTLVGCASRQSQEDQRELPKLDSFAALHMDPLTGLPDRAAFEDRLAERCVSNAGSGLADFAVLFIDLDGFKRVNDQLGHRHGDSVLRTVAQRLRRAVRPGDLVTRFGGDEFTVLLDAVHAVNDAIGVAQRLLAATGDDAVAAPGGKKVSVSVGIALGGKKVSVSVGIALGRAGMNPADLIDAADRAMYRAKAAGGGTWAVAEGDSPS